MNNARDFCDHNTQNVFRRKYFVSVCKILILAKQTSLCPSGSPHRKESQSCFTCMERVKIPNKQNPHPNVCTIPKDFRLGRVKKLWSLFSSWSETTLQEAREPQLQIERRASLSIRRAIVSSCLKGCHISFCKLNLRTSNNLISGGKGSLHNIPSIFMLHWKLAHCILNCSCFSVIHTFTTNGTAVASHIFDFPCVSLIFICLRGSLGIFFVTVGCVTRFTLSVSSESRLHFTSSVVLH